MRALMAATGIIGAIRKNRLAVRALQKCYRQVRRELNAIQVRLDEHWATLVEMRREMKRRRR